MKNKQELNSDNIVDFTQYREKAVKSKKPPVKKSRVTERAAQELIYDAWESANKKTSQRSSFAISGLRRCL